MASIENRSRFLISVQNRDDLAQAFAYTREKALRAYIAELKAQGFKPKLARANDSYAIRVREVGQRSQCLYASSEQEAIDIKQRLELERRNGLFVDYGKGRSVTLGDLMARYLREECPRHKGFEVEGYILNAILADAGLPRIDIAQALADHPNPHPILAGKTFRRSAGKSVRLPAPTACFVRKPFADIVPEDISDYIDDRCQSVQPATVDREVDLFSAVCNIAIDTWRIPVAKNPMDGVRRPRYFNERDRRLKGDEEKRLLDSAYEEDAQKSIEHRVAELTACERSRAQQAGTVYQRKSIVKAARAANLSEAEATYIHVPWFEAFVQFQTMTAARRSETLALGWNDVDLDQKTAFIAESKNGRSRHLALRKEVVELLRQLPRDGAAVFPMTVDAIRKAWGRICERAGLVGENELHLHDLRHEGISRTAEAGSNLPGGFTLADLQAFSGHLDTRMLLRYTHLCMPSFARRLDEAFANEPAAQIHRGRRRLRKGSELSMRDLVNASQPTPTVAETPVPADHRPLSNVVAFRPRRVA